MSLTTSQAGPDPDIADAALVGLSERIESGTVDPHTHRRGQLLYAERGSLTASTDAGAWVLPPHRALWIPAGHRHSFTVRRTADVRMLYVAPGVKGDIPWAGCVVVAVQPLLRELVLALGKAQPLLFGSPGLGSHLHLLGELLNQRLGLKLEHVSYKGLGPAIPDAVSGATHLLFGGIPPLLPLIRDGRLRAIVTTGAARAAALPEIPTLAENGQTDLVITGWFGLLAPKGTRSELIERIYREIRAVAETDAYRQRVAATQAVASLLPPAEFAQFIAAESKRWSEAARIARVKLE